MKPKRSDMQQRDKIAPSCFTIKRYKLTNNDGGKTFKTLELTDTCKVIEAYSHN